MSDHSHHNHNHDHSGHSSPVETTTTPSTGPILGDISLHNHDHGAAHGGAGAGGEDMSFHHTMMHVSSLLNSCWSIDDVENLRWRRCQANRQP